MQRLRRSARSLSELSRSRRNDLMGLGKGEALKPGREVTTAKGTKKVKFQETYEGIPIMGASAVFEEDQDGGATSDATGQLVGGVEDDIPSIKPRLSANEVFSMVARKNQDNPASAQFDPEKDAILEVILDETLGETAHARLAYKLSYRVEVKGRLSRPSFLVDANTGDIIKKWEGLSFQKITKKTSGSDRVHSNYDLQTVGGNLKIGKANYDGKRYPKLEVTKLENGNCTLMNNVAKVFDCGGSWYCYGGTPYTFDCEEGLSDGINGAYSPLADALFYISATYEMFAEWYNIKDPLKRSDSDPGDSVCGARIHYGEQFENAFWDGYFITFGDGNSTFYPLTSINVVAHEISHGITELTSGLIYQGESGGINEAFSDMAGEAVEFYANKKQDWMIGYEIFKHPDKALRYFNDPKKDGRSLSHYKNYCPGIDVHFSSGVFNRAFYFLGRTKGWDVKKAFEPFVVANVLYWIETSRFFEAACGVVRATKDLGYNADDVIAAFRKVGIEPCEDTSTGILQTAEINVPAGHEVLIQVNITKDMVIDQMSVKSFGGRMTLNVHTPNCEFCSRKSSSRNNIDICDVATGLYEISLIPDHDLVKGAVLITGQKTNIFSNGTLKSHNDTIEFEFQLSEETVKSGGQIILAMSTEYGYTSALIRHGEKPILESYEFDIGLESNSFSLVCDLKTGTYYGIIVPRTYQARGIYIDTVDILSGKRMDTPPLITRPTTPPTTPGPSTPQPSTNEPSTLESLPTKPPTKVPPTKEPPTKKPPTKEPPTKKPPTKEPPTVGPTDGGSGSGSELRDTEGGDDGEDRDTYDLLMLG